MVALHDAGATAVLVAIVVAGLATAFIGWRGGSPWTDRIRVGLTVVIGLQVLAGSVLLLTGHQPREPLHLLYGGVTLLVLPAAAAFATEAPPRDRAWVVAAACGLLLLLAWRLTGTG